MRKLFIALLLLGTTTVNAQTVKETFDSNSLGWTEVSDKNGEAVIKEGVMSLTGKNSGGATFFGYKLPWFIETHCYSSLDVTKNFEIKCDAIAKKINNAGCFGVMMDYIDNGNFMVFVIDNEYAHLMRFVDSEMIGRITNRLKLVDKKRVNIALRIKSSYQKLQFYVNDMLAIEARYLPLESNGFGFYVLGEQVVDFDNVEFIQ